MFFKKNFLLIISIVLSFHMIFIKDIFKLKALSQNSFEIKVIDIEKDDEFLNIKLNIKKIKATFNNIITNIKRVYNRFISSKFFNNIKEQTKKLFSNLFNSLINLKINLSS